MITPYNLLRHELVGLDVNIIHATHKGYMVSGRIVDETRNTLKVETTSGIRTIPKNCITFELKLSNDAIVRVDGNLLISRPEDRIKRKYRIKFI
jgi:ribonuclease P protein subunit POP4